MTPEAAACHAVALWLLICGGLLSTGWLAVQMWRALWN